MTTQELREHLAQLQRTKCDVTHIEAKSARNELPKRLWETISAFSNTHMGGTLILGIAEEDGFKIVGIKDTKKIQQDLASMCDTMQPPVRPYIQIHRINGQHVITADIPELPPSQKPCYHPSAGLTNGAFIRVADGDRKLTAYEVQVLLSAHGQPRDDEEPVPGTTTDDLQPRLVISLLSRLRRRRGSNFVRASDESILRTLKVLVRTNKGSSCSLAGLLALGKYPQQFFPALAMTLVVYPGTNVGEPGPTSERFLDNVRIEGAIPDMLRPTFEFLRRNMRQRSIVRGVYREDVDEYPVVAIREAVINALVHRDLSTYARGTPVQVQMFSNRLVVHNPGGLFGPVTVDSLGREGISATRNSTLLRLLEDIAPRGDRQAVCENRGSGVGAMLVALSQSQLPPAEFDDRISTFGVTFFNTLLSRRKDRRSDIASLLHERGELSRAQIAQVLGVSDFAVRKWLATMRSEGTIVAVGAKTKSKNVRYALSSKR